MEIFVRFLALVFFTTTTAFAQLTPGSTAPDFTIRDTDGNEHNLYSILDEGKPVLLDLFATWCAPCWSFAETGVFEEFNAAYGPDGDNSAFTMAIESDAATPVAALSGSGNATYGDWTSIIDYPLADDADASIAVDYGITGYPSIFLICPDRTVTQIGQGPVGGTGFWTLETLTEKVFTCPEPVEGSNAVMKSYNGELVSCGGGAIEPVVKILNMGTEEMTSCTIQTIVGGAVISSHAWTGALATYRSEEVTLNELPLNTRNVSFNVVMTGDTRTTDDKIDVEITIPTESHAYVHVQVNTDFFPGETAWGILDLNKNIIISDSYESGNEQFGGGGPDAEKTHNYFQSLDEGCYVFMVYDQRNDGLQGFSGYGSGEDGSVVVTDGEGLELLNVSGNWGFQQLVFFEVTHGVGIEEVSENSILIFPNPASNNATVALSLSESDDVTIEVVNTLGQQVFVQTAKMNAGPNTVQIPVEKLITGMYYVNIRIADEIVSKKLNIMK